MTEETMEMLKEMTEEERRKLLKEKREQLEELKKEITKLNVKSIAALTTEPMLGIDGFFRNAGNAVWCEKKTDNPCKDGWKPIVQVCKELFRNRHIGENLTEKAMSKREIETAAKMADEIIKIWNKYFQNEYKERFVDEEHIY